ncbi:glycerophosphodiester phosphodiesterase [Terrihabitans rhizophilus]|uniref:glycerophosphodiester phosphodiesterase n=1 Tax=Terrihabitans rhizophilus TaxID=3092662 RepID=A0ABU4RQA0_9HYPH|nr:glycerophosphodiester phosphodiesterase [Terrihabitans sp. PJ23]MDX6807023.1 glycerophosphodiester phosphodiesterase [Terrihabitans sp. PJ23]
MIRTLLLLSASLIATSAGTAAAQWKTLNGERPVIVAHRGASGYMPDHTLEAYKRAVDMGADFIEPDLVSTKDGELVARHEPMLSGTTDVADRPEFASYKRTRNIDGAPVTDWFACDFTLAEIRTLRARQPLPERDPQFDGKFTIPTLQEVIDLAKAESTRTGRTIGIAPETKHPIFHSAMGVPLEDRLIGVLTAAGWTGADAPVVIQSFEVANLKYLNSRIDVRLAQLIDGGDVDMEGRVGGEGLKARPYDFTVTGDPRTNHDLLTPEGLAEIRTYAEIVSPWKPYLVIAKQVDENGDGKPDDLNGDGKMDERDRVLVGPTEVIQNAHKAGLQVYTWTMRSEPRRLLSTYKGDPAAEYRAFFDLGLDGVFSDHTDHAVAARDKR